MNNRVIYSPTPLNSMNEICRVLGVGPKRVKNWIRQGAPIAVEGVGPKTRYGAELGRLMLWREQWKP